MSVVFRVYLRTPERLPETVMRSTRSNYFHKDRKTICLIHFFSHEYIVFSRGAVMWMLQQIGRRSRCEDVPAFC